MVAFSTILDYHNIIYANSGICVPLSPKNAHEVWDFSKADAQNLKISIKIFNWGKTPESLLIALQVYLLNKSFWEIFGNLS